MQDIKRIESNPKHFYGLFMQLHQDNRYIQTLFHTKGIFCGSSLFVLYFHSSVVKETSETIEEDKVTRST